FRSFSVEDFQPPRIEVALKPEADYATDEDKTISIAIDAKYLFGSPVSGAPWEALVSAQARPFSHPDWRSFFFPSSLAATPDVHEFDGTLDGEGKGVLDIHPGENWTAPSMAVTASVRVREDGGRWLTRAVTLPYYTRPELLGYEPGKEEPMAGSSFPLRIAAVKPDGTASESASASATVSRLEHYYVRSDRGYTQASRAVFVAEIPVALSQGVGAFNFTPPQRGTYKIAVKSDGGATMETTLHVDAGVVGSGDGASSLIDRVMLSWEQPRHQLGQTALLKVRSPFPGKLMIILEGEKEILRMVQPLEGTETTISLPVSPAALPNAYCSAWVIRPVREGEKWGAHRAFGIIPLMLDRSSSQLKVAIDAPEKTQPKKDLPVAIAITDAQGRPASGEVTLAFVDEALLSLTNFKTPDPFAFFTAKRAAQGMSYDIYDDLMPLSTGRSLNLTPGGGMFAESGSLLSPMSRKLTLLSIFLGSVKTDADGIARTTLQLPEYSGKGRIMAVAATKDAVGSGESAVGIARELTVEATTPRMLAPGDSAETPLVIFGDGKNSVKARISIETDGPLLASEKSFSVSLDAQNAKVTLPLTLKAGEGGGMAALRVVTRIAGRENEDFEQRFEIPVRPPFPRMTKSGGGAVKGGQKALIDIAGGFYPGTQRVSLSFAGTPGVTLMSALDYLGSYPYGCLEQTTSAAWRFLAVPAMLRSLDPEMAKDTVFRQGLDFAIRRILAMQFPDGGFTAWPGTSGRPTAAWASVYAIHFLTEARSTGLVPKDALRASLGWMRSYLAAALPESRHDFIDALSAKAYIAYVLALNNDAPLGWMQFLKDQGQYLSPSARIFLAGAYSVATGKPDALRELGVQPIPRFGRYGQSLESAPRNEALRLLMWVGVDPFGPETSALAKRVIEDSAANRWRSTQENAMGIIAIGRYIEKTLGAGGDFTATLSTSPPSGDKPKELAVFTDKDTPSFTRGSLSPAPPAAPYPLSLNVSGDGTAFYSWTSSGVPTGAPEPFAEGLAVARRWVLPDGAVYDFL
ncbi:MAG: hypothetical protein LBV01_03975, partial [Deltaproteobacteria bacterium]|nr:hypothetical protein [Deltaproteobacteria bacterium]